MSVLDKIELASYAVEAALAAVFAVLSFRRAGKGDDAKQKSERNASLFFYLLTGFFACISMSNIFYLLTWIVQDYPFVFSPGDISWVGGIVFLITAAMSRPDDWTPEEKREARKRRLPAMLAPAVCIIFNVAYIAVYPDILVNYLLYGVPTSILAYYSLWLSLASIKGGVKPAMRLYHLAVLLWVADQLIYDLFSTIGIQLPVVILSFILTALMAAVYYAALRGFTGKEVSA